MKRSVYIGWDPREAAACEIAERSLRSHMSRDVPVHSLRLSGLGDLYRRPTVLKDGRLWDVISEAPMATEHACARFFVKELAGSGWVLFMDGDVLVRADVNELFDSLGDKAVYCVQHCYEPVNTVKMDGQVQTLYPRKNWSSVFALNVDHPANAGLTVDLINTVPGRDLHRFCWLSDDDIGALDPAWNFLAPVAPKIVHFTEGVPDMPGYADQPYAEEWRSWL